MTANVPILLTGIVEAGLFGNIGISELFLSLRGGLFVYRPHELEKFSIEISSRTGSKALA